MEWTDHRLNKVEALVEENNKILRRLQRTARWTQFFVFVKWVVILGASFGLYYYLQPLVDGWLSTYQSLWQQAGNLGESLPFLGGSVEESLTTPR